MTEEVKNINFMAAHIESNTIYGAGFNQNILFQYDVEQKKLNRLEVFSKFKKKYGYKICKMYKYREKLYCFSKKSYEVAAYHLDRKEIIYFSPEEEMEKQLDIRCVCRVKNDIWLFQEIAAQYVMIFSMENEKYKKIAFDISVLAGYNLSFYVGSETVVYWNEKIWRCIPGNSAFVLYDPQTQKIEVIDIDANILFHTVNCLEGKFFILGRDGKQIVMWKPYTNELVVWNTGYKGEKDRAFREIICSGNHLFLLPCFEEDIFYYEIQGEELNFVSRIEYPEEFKRLHNIKGESLFNEYKFQNEKELYLFPLGGNGMLCLNIESLDMNFYPVQITEQDYIVNNFKSGETLSDCEIKIKDYISFIKMNGEQDRYGTRKNMTGTSCWEGLKQVK